MNTSSVKYIAPNKRILFEKPITRITKINPNVMLSATKHSGLCSA